MLWGKRHGHIKTALDDSLPKAKRRGHQNEGLMKDSRQATTYLTRQALGIFHNLPLFGFQEDHVREYLPEGAILVRLCHVLTIDHVT